MTVPKTTLAPLHRADGSATYSHGGYTILAAVNGPIEVQRRDELPDEAALEVNVRPAIGVGGPRERHLELLLASTLRHMLLTHLHPRTLVQVTLQVLDAPSPSPLSVLPLLAPLLNATLPALLHACLPLTGVFGATTIALTAQGAVADPGAETLRTAKSVHALALMGEGKVLLSESEGRFSVDEWEQAVAKAREVVAGVLAGVSKAVQGRIAKDEAWRAE